MKRQVDKTGGKLWFNENLIDGFQDQLYKALESHYKPYGSCIISGCEVSGSNIAEGIVYLDGKIMPFAGASGITFPKYLKSQMTPVTAAYDDGHSDTTEEIYEAILSSTIPSSEYITISAQGGKTFRQAFQDANNRMVSDAKINEWNASRVNAVSDVRGDVAESFNTLKKISDSAYFERGSLDDANSTTRQGLYLIKANAANSPVTSYGSLYNALIDGNSQFQTQLFVSQYSEMFIRYMHSGTWHSWVRIASSNEVTSKANAAKEEAISTAASDATSKANTAKSEAISAASSDATNKANAAKEEAISTAASDATSKANTAKSEAISAASSDATSKADVAKGNAISELREGVSETFNTLNKIADKTYFERGKLDDVNMTTRHGLYLVNTNAANSPFTSFGCLYNALIDGNSQYQTQMLISQYGSVYFRHMHDGAWGGWQTVAMQGSTITANDVIIK
jgi:hypothetical protein